MSRIAPALVRLLLAAAVSVGLALSPLPVQAAEGHPASAQADPAAQDRDAEESANPERDRDDHAATNGDAASGEDAASGDSGAGAPADVSVGELPAYLEPLAPIIDLMPTPVRALLSRQW